MTLDLTGHVYKRLTVLSFHGQTKQGREWLCKCECGNTCIVRGNSLRSGNTTSCGCYHREECTSRLAKSFRPGRSAVTTLFSRYRRQARKRGLSWGLTREQFTALLKLSCTYCGVEYFNSVEMERETFTYNGIDRVENDKGYYPGNVVTCCKRCNIAKHVMSLGEFQDWVFKVAERFKENGVVEGVAA